MIFLGPICYGEKFVNSIVKCMFSPTLCFESEKDCFVNWAKASQQISEPVSLFHLEFFNSRIDKQQHMHFFTLNTILVKIETFRGTLKHFYVF